MTLSGHQIWAHVHLSGQVCTICDLIWPSVTQICHSLLSTGLLQGRPTRCACDKVSCLHLRIWSSTYLLVYLPTYLPTYIAYASTNYQPYTSSLNSCAPPDLPDLVGQSAPKPLAIDIVIFEVCQLLFLPLTVSSSSASERIRTLSFRV